MIYEAGKKPDSSPELQKLLNLPDSTHWVPARPSKFGRWSWTNSKDENRACQHESGRFAGPETLTQAGEPIPVGSDTPTLLPAAIISWAGFMLSRKIPFPARRWIGSGGWATRPRKPGPGNLAAECFPGGPISTFFNFLIPGVTSVPIYAFLVLMTLFTIVIGPLNYIFLRRRKRTYLLAVDDPRDRVCDELDAIRLFHAVLRFQHRLANPQRDGFGPAHEHRRLPQPHLACSRGWLPRTG